VSERPRVWITRAEPGAAATAARLESLGLEAVIAPALTLKPLDAAVELDGVAALAFTSSNGVQAFAARSAERGLPVFAVGEVTTKAARRAGFADVTSANGDVSALARLIVSTPPAGLVLHPGPVQRAGDLVGALKRKGIAARTLSLYEAVGADALTPEIATALAERTLSAVLIHSPRAAEVLAPLLAPFDLSEITALGLSKACLRPFARLAFAQTIAAKAPTETALMDAALAALGNPARSR